MPFNAKPSTSFDIFAENLDAELTQPTENEFYQAQDEMEQGYRVPTPPPAEEPQPTPPAKPAVQNAEIKPKRAKTSFLEDSDDDDVATSDRQHRELAAAAESDDARRVREKLELGVPPHLCFDLMGRLALIKQNSG